MSDAGGPYLLDVGVIALAHTETPVRDAALSYVRDAITGDIDAVVPYPALFGAHAVLTTYYGRSNAEASQLMDNFIDASRIHWYDRIPSDAVRGRFARAAETNFGGWESYYAQVVVDGGVSTVVTIDDDFGRFDAFATDVILTSEEFERLNRYLGGDT